jgi:hypothetical protein
MANGPAVTLNQAPVVSAGGDLLVHGSSTTLAGAVNDDGLPNGQLSAQWSFVSGPGAVSFAAPTNPVTSVSFGGGGRYTLRLTATDGMLSRSDDVLIVVEPGPNVAPSVYAGADQVVAIDAGALLVGQVFDDGQPAGGTVSVSWSKIDGPGIVAFSSPSTATTNASFGTIGDYNLRLTASDGALSRTDDVHIRVIAAGNAPPTVDLGPDQTLDYGQTASFHPVINDDGQPGGRVFTTWQQTAGPDALDLAFAANGSITASFPAAGIYQLRLTADDGALITSDEVTFTVRPVATAEPIVVLNSPLNGASIQRGQTIRLRATASDPDPGGSIASIAFYADDALLGVATAFDNTGAAEWSWTAAILGSHSLYAVRD